MDVKMGMEMEMEMESVPIREFQALEMIDCME